MRIVREEQIGDRRVKLTEHAGRYSVALEVRGPIGLWEDISLLADQNLTRGAAEARYRQRVSEQRERRVSSAAHPA